MREKKSFCFNEMTFNHVLILYVKFLFVFLIQFIVLVVV